MISKVFPSEDEYFSAQETQGWPVGIWIAPSRSPTRWQIHAERPLGALPSRVIQSPGPCLLRLQNGCEWGKKKESSEGPEKSAGILGSGLFVPGELGFRKD